MTRLVIIAAVASAILMSGQVLFLGTSPSHEGLGPEARLYALRQEDEATSRRDFMRTKLLYSQNILEGLTTGSFEMLDESVRELQMVTEGAQWVDIGNEDYRRLTEEFKLAAERLKEAAATRNIDAAAMRFYQLSTSCIDCHKHIRHAGYDL